ncbi:MAG: stage V sporulation protein AD [Ruminococcaceae bacterium]|nr:stage V sporulation protein AD [Oscillospiraceae bacterium]
MGNGLLKMQKRTFIISSGSVVGQKEKHGPLGEFFDLSGDDRFGKDTWEKSEAEMQRLALGIALRKAELMEDIDVLFAGDLINQCISSSYGLLEYKFPFLGLFGACSTCAEGLLMSAVYASTVSTRCAAVTSSHFCSAERQFRYPLEYGGQRPPTSQWTVTGSGAFVVSSDVGDVQLNKSKYVPEIVEVMPGRMIDRGISDANNMGAAMAPSAVDTLERYFSLGHAPDEFDLIITGDLGREGSGILIDLLSARGIDISKNHVDCGNMVFEPTSSDTHAGGSGCGCSAVVMSADILENLRRGKVSDILFLGTGALMNPMSVSQGQTIPGIAHLLHIRGAEVDSI